MSSCGDMAAVRPPGTAATGTNVAAALWKKFWLLFTAIWVAVSLLHVLTLVMLGDEVPRERLEMLLLATILVPAVLYSAGWLWERLRRG
jgi:hypothetical protein